MAKQQTEIDIGGIKFKGGRVFLIITILSSFIGVLWGGFEAYQRYLDMEAKINSFVSPDLSGFDKKLEVFAELCILGMSMFLAAFFCLKVLFNKTIFSGIDPGLNSAFGYHCSH